MENADKTTKRKRRKLPRGVKNPSPLEAVLAAGNAMAVAIERLERADDIGIAVEDCAFARSVWEAAATAFD